MNDQSPNQLTAAARAFSQQGTRRMIAAAREAQKIQLRMLMDSLKRKYRRSRSEG